MKAKRLIAFISIGVVSLLAVTGAILVLPGLFKEAPSRVFVGGDSLAGGYFASTVSLGFRDRVFDELNTHPDFEGIKYGFPHWRLSEIIREPLPLNLDLAIIEIGTNDFGQTPLSEFRSLYDDFLHQIREGSPTVKLICLGVWRSPATKVNGFTALDYDRHIKESCIAAHGTFISLSDIYIMKGTRGPEGVQTETGISDGFHPNDLGHELIADAILKDLK